MNESSIAIKIYDIRWDLYLSLSAEDQYNLTQIWIHLGNSQPEFDQLVLALVKVFLEMVNLILKG